MEAILTSDNRPAIKVKGTDHYTGDDEFTVHVLTLQEARALWGNLGYVCREAESYAASKLRFFTESCADAVSGGMITPDEANAAVAKLRAELGFKP